MAETRYVTCPFCGDGDFDLIGLRLHFLRGWCDVFNETPQTDPPAAAPVCDCQNPEPAEGAALVSMECPIHNLYPRPKPGAE